MRTIAFALTSACLALAVTGLGESAGDARYVHLIRVRDALLPLAKKLAPPKEGDWLDRFHEKAQTFEEYVRTDPVLAQEGRRALCVQPLGDFDPSQSRVVSSASEYMGAYFGLPLRPVPARPLKDVPEWAHRTTPYDEQLLTTYVLQNLLKPTLPKDASALVAFTASDLWPGQGWNYVFGQATLRDRVAVFSLHRFGHPSAGEKSRRECLLRTCKVSTHEIGHMFSIPHFALYECNMCGSNSLEETDRCPPWLCPECLAKLCWATGADPLARCRSLERLARQFGDGDQAAFYARSAKAIEAVKP